MQVALLRRGFRLCRRVLLVSLLNLRDQLILRGCHPSRLLLCGNARIIRIARLNLKLVHRLLGLHQLRSRLRVLFVDGGDLPRALLVVLRASNQLIFQCSIFEPNCLKFAVHLGMLRLEAFVVLGNVLVRRLQVLENLQSLVLRAGVLRSFLGKAFNHIGLFSNQQLQVGVLSLESLARLSRRFQQLFRILVVGLGVLERRVQHVVVGLNRSDFVILVTQLRLEPFDAPLEHSRLFDFVRVQLLRGSLTRSQQLQVRRWHPLVRVFLHF